jgi:tetratricopeptide (TPR) repeat protein
MDAAVSEIHGVRALLERSEFAPALQLALRLQQEAPENRDLLYMIAVAQRYVQRVADALATLGRLEELHPDYPRLYQERGHCYVALRSAPPAIAAFEQAVKMSPALPASWKALEILYRMTGQLDAAKKAAAEVDNLA